jgi:NAD(P)H-dependent FMN reductase
MNPHILIILASIRENRQGETVARWFHRLASRRKDFDAELVDLKEWSLPFYHEAKTPVAMEHEYTDPKARAWVEKVEGADGFILVTSEYNNGYPPTLKNALDYVYTGWNNKPMACVSYGGPGAGMRSVAQLRQVAVELQMAPIRGEVNIPFVARAFNELGEPLEATHVKRADAMFDQLVWWADALAEARQRTQPVPSGR